METLTSTLNSLRYNIVGLQRHITLENGYKAACVITTLAVTALDRQAPGWCMLGTLVLTAANVYYFNRKVQQDFGSSEPLFRKWLAITCLATGAILLGITAASVLPSIGYGLTALKTLHFTEALFHATNVTGLIGFLIPASIALFKRGEELLKMREWRELKNILEESFFKDLKFVEKCSLIPTLLFPEACFRWLNVKMTLIAFIAISPKTKAQQAREIYKHYQALPSYLLIEKNQLWDLFLIALVPLQGDVQYNLFEEVLLHNSDKKDVLLRYLSLENQNNYNVKAEKEDKHLQDRIPIINIELDKLATQLKSTNVDLSAINLRFTTLNQEVVKLISSAKIYSPDRVSSLNTLQTRFLQGEIFQKLQELNREREKPLDREEFTVSILATNLTLYSGIKNLMKEFDNAALHAKLEEEGIEEIGKFVDKVLDGDEKRLTQPDEIIRRLKLYLGAKNRIYTFLSGNLKEKTAKMDRMLARIVYRSVLIFTALVPIIKQPAQIGVGMFLYATLRILHAEDDPLPTSADRPFDLIGILCDIATRRPLLSLISPTAPPEMRTFESASLTGRARILSTELACGWVLAETGHQKTPISGYILGLTIAKEVTEAAERWWASRRYRAPAPLAVPA